MRLNFIGFTEGVEFNEDLSLIGLHDENFQSTPVIRNYYQIANMDSKDMEFSGFGDRSGGKVRLDKLRKICGEMKEIVQYGRSFLAERSRLALERRSSRRLTISRLERTQQDTDLEVGQDEISDVVPELRSIPLSCLSNLRSRTREVYPHSLVTKK